MDEARSILTFDDPLALAEQAAERVVSAADGAVARRGRFTLVLAGGSTPRALYRQLAAHPAFPWTHTLFLFGDERCVPPTHERSNHRMAREALLDPLGVPAEQVLRMEGELDPAEAARRYESRLRDLFPGAAAPRFDLVLLGMGPDGHTASLFPGTAALAERTRWVVANHVPQQDEWRLTLSLPALNAAALVIFLVTGQAKARVTAEAFGGREHAEPYPCERIAPEAGRVLVLCDRAAAAEL